MGANDQMHYKQFRVASGIEEARKTWALNTKIISWEAHDNLQRKVKDLIRNLGHKEDEFFALYHQQRLQNRNDRNEPVSYSLDMNCQALIPAILSTNLERAVLDTAAATTNDEFIAMKNGDCYSTGYGSCVDKESLTRSLVSKGETDEENHGLYVALNYKGNYYRQGYKSMTDCTVLLDALPLLLFTATHNCRRRVE